MYLTKYFITHKKNDNLFAVINTLTGDFCYLEKSEINYLSENEISRNSLPNHTAEKLQTNKIIYRNAKEEEREIQAIKKECRKRSIENDPTVYVIYITYDCNITCNYCCYQYLKVQKKIISKKTIQEIFIAIKKIQKQSGRKSSRICLFGGEPLMMKNYDEVSSYFKILRNHITDELKEGRKCESIIFTNGVDIPFYGSLLERNRDIISKVLVTLIGNEEENNRRRKHFNGNGTFSKVISGIEILLDKNITVWAVANIDKNNVTKIPDLIELVKSKEWHLNKHFAGYYIGRIKYYESTDKSSISENELLKAAIGYLENDKVAQKILNFGDMRNLKPILNMIDNPSSFFQKFYSCSSGDLQQFSFGSDKDIYTCSGSMGIKEYALGSYSPSLCISKRKKEFWTSRDVLSIEKCKSCNVAFLCGGGCYYAAKAINGSEYKPICVPIEELLHTYIDARGMGVKIQYKDLLRD